MNNLRSNEGRVRLLWFAVLWVLAVLAWMLGAFTTGWSRCAWVGGGVVLVSLSLPLLPRLGNRSLELPPRRDGHWAVTLVSEGPTPIAALRVIREVRSVDLSTALALTKSLPLDLVHDADEVFARAVANALTDARAKATLSKRR